MTVQQENSSWTEVLGREETQESLSYILTKLPDIQKILQSSEQVFYFVQAFLEDKETMDQFESKLSAYPINAETIDASIQLLGKLPMLLEHVTLLEQITVFVKDVIGDDTSMEQITNSINELPFVKEGKELSIIVGEVKERASKGTQENVSIFTLIKWLKDPTVQKGLHYMKTTLDVLGEK